MKILFALACLAIGYGIGLLHADHNPLMAVRFREFFAKLGAKLRG